MLALSTISTSSFNQHIRFRRCVKCLFVKQWQNDTNPACNILSTRCPCNITVIKRSLKAKMLILRKLGSRQFPRAHRFLSYRPFCISCKLVKENRKRKKGRDVFPLLSSRQKISVSKYMWKMAVFTSSAFCSRFRMKNSYMRWRQLCLSFSQSVKENGTGKGTQSKSTLGLGLGLRQQQAVISFRWT